MGWSSEHNASLVCEMECQTISQGPGCFFFFSSSWAVAWLQVGFCFLKSGDMLTSGGYVFRCKYLKMTWPSSPLPFFFLIIFVIFVLASFFFSHIKTCTESESAYIWFLFLLVAYISCSLNKISLLYLTENRSDLAPCLTFRFFLYRVQRNQS